MIIRSKQLTAIDFNWEQGVWQGSGGNPDNARTAHVCIAGDWAPIRAFAPIIEQRSDAVYGDLLAHLEAADLSIVNLEAPLSDIGLPVNKSGAVFKGGKKHARGLAPFDAVTLANNHVFDFGVAAFDETIKALESMNIKWTGAGKNLDQAASPLIMEKNGLKIAVVNFSEGEDLTAATMDKPGVMGWDLPRMEATVASLRKQADCIMVIAHCGIEYIPFPPPYVAKAFERMVDAGADIVIGHHPHVPQGVQFYKDVPIFYSLGNFVFYQPTDLKFRKLGLMVDVGIDPSGIFSFEILPYEIHDHGLELLKEGSKQAFFHKFKEISLPLDRPETLEQTWHAFLTDYGAKGFFNEMNMILDKIKTDPQKGAAMFRNRLTTLQHHTHLKDLMTLMVEDKMENQSPWAKNLIHQWLILQQGLPKRLYGPGLP
jgi:poly-gamma-glutamate capsule biosynthesis protein CapA/YwtB (metallophosphatase superfamily)